MQIQLLLINHVTLCESWGSVSSTTAYFAGFLCREKGS